MAGFFIAVEGIDGSGKSTQVPFICETLKHFGLSPRKTAEPGGTPLASAIRRLMTSAGVEQPCDLAELLMMYAARAQHVERKIRPWLEAGRVVVSDRFDLSTLAYQGYGRQMPIQDLEVLRGMVVKDTSPDLTILFDCDISVALSRLIVRGGLDRLEREDISFFSRVRNAYLGYARAHQDSVVVIDANVGVAETRQQILRVLADWRSAIEKKVAAPT